ncbi:MAG: hypothetical protein IH964_05640 [Candidatus Dadabacteria bacterium]|nr:hypothetical protein [Candidatus Dadabacteria bacterium]
MNTVNQIELLDNMYTRRSFPFRRQPIYKKPASRTSSSYAGKMNATDHRSRYLHLIDLEIDGIAGKPKQRDLRELDEDEILTLEFAERHKGKKRMSALYQVLTILPENDYQELKALGRFYCYLPEKDTLASVKDLPIGVIYIYLSAKLEDLSDDWIRHSVAHELAHALLGHTEPGLAPSERLEKEADKKAKFWGFGKPVEE